MDDYFAAQWLIIDRLKECLPELRTVRAMTGADDVKELGRGAPAAYVINTGEFVFDGLGGPELGGQAIEPYWTVVLVVRSTREMVQGRGILGSAGPLLAGINKALLDWTPDSLFKPIRKASPARPSFQEGFGYYPQTFVTRMAVRGNLTV